jgi:hypothetical protein
MNHLILLGDSIFDNGDYTRGGPDVIAQVRELLPKGWRATLLALDGATTQQTLLQVERVPRDATHLVLSVGGNDALWQAGIIQAPARSVAGALDELAAITQDFERNYRTGVAECMTLALPLTICTVYNGCFLDPDYQRRISVALTVFNDVILRVGIEFSLAMIDLRAVCSSPDDYANAIEPSSVGGAKIARAIVNAVLPPDGKSTTARVIAR